MNKKLMSAWACGLLAAGCVSKPSNVGSSNVGGSSVETLSGEIVVVTQNAQTAQWLQKEFKTTTLDAKDGAYLVRGRSNGGSIAGQETDLIAQIERQPGVLFAEPNYVRSIGQSVPRNQKWLEQWSFKNYGQDAPKGAEGLKGADMKALEAWTVTKGNRDVVVAVLDSGVDYTHPDLIENAWVNTKERDGVPGEDDDGNGYVDDIYGWKFVSSGEDSKFHGQLGSPDPLDDNGHGTHVAGTIGAHGSNGGGVVGINWTVRIMALKFLSSIGSGSSADEYRALKYVVASKTHVDVINASYGGGGESKLIRMALKEVTEKGTLFVAAAGNDATDNDVSPHWPSNYALPGVISVAATDNRDQLAEFSNYGLTTVDIAAPGVNIVSTYPVEVAKKEEDKSPYRVFSGTSMATPHVVGAAALVLAADSKLRHRPADLKARLMSSVDYLPHLAGFVKAAGRLNLNEAVRGTVGTSPLAMASWKEEAFDLRTNDKPTDLIDHAWKIHKPGAKAIRVHVATAVIDQPYDLAILYDRLYRPIFNFPEMVADTWLPPVMGDTAYLKFSNALVSVQKYLGDVAVDDPDKVAGDEYPICWKEKSQWMCSRYSPQSKPFANFGSESIVIDRIQYLE